MYSYRSRANERADTATRPRVIGIDYQNNPDRMSHWRRVRVVLFVIGLSFGLTVATVPATATGLTETAVTDDTPRTIQTATSEPTAAFSYSPSTPNPDDEITLDASSSTDNGSITEYEWDTDGDGNYGELFGGAKSGQTTTISFDSAGTYTIGLRVTDDQGNTDTITKTITVENPAPTAEFTYSPSDPNPDDTITLDASSSSDLDGSITSYEWDTDGDGNYGELFGGAKSGQTTTISFDSGGTYTVGLKVTDNGGKTDTITKTITVENPAPEISFTVSPSNPHPDDTITLDASGSFDSDGSIVSYEWDTDGDGNYGETWNDADDGQTATISFDSGGTYTVGLKITDNGGKTRTLTKTITVSNPAPNASLSVSTSDPRPDDEITLDASGSNDGDGSITSYEWDTDGDGEYGETWDDVDDGQTATISFDSSGTYTVGVKITDNGGKTDTIRKTITVRNRAPNASLSVSTSDPRPDDEITLDASGSNDGDGSVTKYEWDTDGDGEYGETWDDADNGQTVTISYDSAGTYTVGVKITDNGGKTDTIRKTITVNNTAPIPSLEVSPDTPNPDDTITLDATDSRDPDGEIVSYEWDTNDDGDFSDYGDADDGSTATISFDSEGTYTVGLRVTDNGGKTVTTSVQITVNNPAPDATFTVSPDTPNPDDQVTLDASGSSDPDGSITKYEWDTNGDGEFSDYGDLDDGERGTITFEKGGNYTVRLRVTDNGGKTTTVKKTITVENPAPTANFSYTVDLSDDLTASFDASDSSDPDGSITSYEWYVDGDREASGQTTTLDFYDKGKYTVTLVVTDNGEKTARASRTISISRPPTANVTLSRTTIGTGQPLQFSAAGSVDPDGQVVSYDWEFSDGETYSGERGSRTFAEPGSYTVTLTVTDDTGGTDTVNRTVRVKVPPSASVSWSPQKPADDALVTFTANSSDTVTTYEWDFDGDGTYDATGKTVEHRFPEGGSKTVTLRAVGPSGVANVIERTIQVRDVKPTANVTWEPQVPRGGQDVVFRANSSDEIASYEWDFDNDGEIEATGQKVTHRFAKNGKQAVVLYITDEYGDEAKLSRIVTLQQSASFSLTGGSSTVKSGETLIVRFAASNKLPDKPISVKLNLNLPGSGVSISGVDGGELAGRSSTRFVTVDPGSDRGFQVRLAFDSAGSYNISATAVYYVGGTDSGARRTTNVGPIEIVVEETTDTASATATSSDAEVPGFTVLGSLLAVLLAVLAVRRFW
jgi:PKD repeat protein